MHFIINVNNGRTLGFFGDVEVKYVDTVSGAEVFTMIVLLCGGLDSRIQELFMVVKKKDRNYPIHSLPDDVPGGSYRTGLKGWMDTRVFPEWLLEKRFIRPFPHNRRRVLCMDNCSGHSQTEELSFFCDVVKTDICYFPPISTHLI